MCELRGGFFSGVFKRVFMPGLRSRQLRRRRRNGLLGLLRGLCLYGCRRKCLCDLRRGHLFGIRGKPLRKLRRGHVPSRIWFPWLL